MNSFDSGPAEIITTGAEARSNIIQRLPKALEQGNKVLQKFVEIKMLKKIESIHSAIARQYIDT